MAEELVQKGSWLEIRRVFPLIAGILIALSLVLPFWGVSMKAPQYPEKELVIKIYANKMVGDIWEVNTLNQYAGVSFPENIPEFKYFPEIIAALTAFSLITAFAPDNLKKKLLFILVAVMLVFLVGALGDLQYRLYIIGHNLNPNAPMKGFPPFTPPLLGPNQIANFSTLSLFRSGGIAIGIAFVLNAIAYFKRNTNTKITAWFKKLNQLLED